MICHAPPPHSVRVRSDHILLGTMCNVDRPDWTVLEEVVPKESLAWFMWMCEVELEDGALVQVYKHRITRRYLHLADDGRAFYYIGGGCYREVDRDLAAVAVFERSVPGRQR